MFVTKKKHRHWKRQWMMILRQVPWLVAAASLLFSSSQNYYSFLVVHAQPSNELYYHHQIVDHVNNSNSNRYHGEEWSQRYYIYDVEFKGPGHPIFLIFGGEGSIEPSTGIMYPFITQYLAKEFGAFVVQPEHRFYGKSQPIPTNKPQPPSGKDDDDNDDDDSTVDDPRVTLFTSEQAIYDGMKLVTYIQTQHLQCSLDRTSRKYCPVITVGGSYPGFLSAASRIAFSGKVDIAYAASAPMKFYSQQVNAEAYYNHITKVAEQTIQGCSYSVYLVLQHVYDYILSMADNDSDDDSIDDSIDDLETKLGICHGSIPKYILDQLNGNEDDFDDSSINDEDQSEINGYELLAQELMMVVGYTFANDNMANYPPNTNATRLYQGCTTFMNCSHDSFYRLKEFLVSRLPPFNDDDDTDDDDGNSNDSDNSCWDMKLQLPSGVNATISSGDWSGVGTSHDGESWDFQTCTLLVEAIGFEKYPKSMFPQRLWTLDWLSKHCQSRFGTNVVPQPYKLVQHWKFTEEELIVNNVTRILFTNGLNDGWSVGGIVTNLSDSLVALNFPNGAHHSDLTHIGPSEDHDTPDIKHGYVQIQSILSTWLNEIYALQQRETTPTTSDGDETGKSESGLGESSTS